MKARFTLQAGQWFAAEIFGDFFAEFTDKRDRTPIRILSLRPGQKGDRTFELDFYHASYPEGVRDKSYTLQTLHRGENFILAKSDHVPPRMMLIHNIDAAWLLRHFGQRSQNENLDDFLNSWTGFR